MTQNLHQLLVLPCVGTPYDRYVTHMGPGELISPPATVLRTLIAKERERAPSSSRAQSASQRLLLISGLLAPFNFIIRDQILEMILIITLVLNLVQV